MPYLRYPGPRLNFGRCPCEKNEWWWTWRVYHSYCVCRWWPGYQRKAPMHSSRARYSGFLVHWIPKDKKKSMTEEINLLEHCSWDREDNSNRVVTENETVSQFSVYARLLLPEQRLTSWFSFSSQISCNPETGPLNSHWNFQPKNTTTLSYLQMRPELCQECHWRACLQIRVKILPNKY